MSKDKETEMSETNKQKSEAMKEWHAANQHPMQGRVHTEEAKQKISEKNKGRKLSSETVEKSAKARRMDPEREQAIVDAYKKQMPVREIAKMFGTGSASVYRILERNNVNKDHSHDSWSGKQHSEETKSKISQSKFQYWEEKKSS